MDKLQMAHEYFMKHGRDDSWMEFDVASAWRYADAMQAEAEKRLNKERPDVLKQEWQPDWSQAPDSADSWTMRPDGKCLWWKGVPVSDGTRFTDLVGGCHTVGYAPSFDYQGNWQNSLRKRPQ